MRNGLIAASRLSAVRLAGDFASNSRCRCPAAALRCSLGNPSMSNKSETIPVGVKEEASNGAREKEEEEGRSQFMDSAGSASGGSGALAVIASLVVGGAGACLYAIRPRDPIFEVTAINLKGLDLRFCTDSPMLMAVVDVELILSIRVTNENVVPIEYTSTIMDIFYRGDLLGQAHVPADSQAANSTRVIELPCKLDGLEMTNHVKDLFKDVTKREMSLHAVVTIAGHARVWKWTHNFEVHVTSDIKVDPIFLNVIEQENKVELELEPPL